MSFDHLQFWYWWVAGFSLLALEAMAPGAIFLWMGVSAFVVGALAWMVDIRWEWQVMIFALLSPACFFAFRSLRRVTGSPDSSTLNRRGHSYVGRNFTLSEPIINGFGKLKVDDSQWRISGTDAPAGCTVRVTRADGVTLHVERLN